MEKHPKKTQLGIIFEYLQKHVATASMVSEATGIPQKNFCRYKRDLERSGLLAQVNRSACKLTGFPAWYLTTDKTKFPPKQQLRLS